MTYFGQSTEAVGRVLRQLLDRVVEAERRGAAQEMRGKVTDVDATKARARIELGKDEDGQPVKSPWIPYKQIAGALKIHQPPTVGETMTLRSASGDVEQGVLEAFHWSDDNPANSTDAQSNVMTFGDCKVTIGTSSIEVEVGGVKATFSGSGFEVTGGEVKHNDKDIGDTHKHSGVISGGDDTGPPV